MSRSEFDANLAMRPAPRHRLTPQAVTRYKPRACLVCRVVSLILAVAVCSAAVGYFFGG